MGLSRCFFWKKAFFTCPRSSPLSLFCPSAISAVRTVNLFHPITDSPFSDATGATLVVACWYSTTYVLFYKPGFEAETPKEAGLFRSPDSLFELNAGDFLLRESAKFSVWRISRTHRFWGEQRKIRVSAFRKRRKMPPKKPPAEKKSA